MRSLRNLSDQRYRLIMFSWVNVERIKHLIGKEKRCLAIFLSLFLSVSGLVAEFCLYAKKTHFFLIFRHNSLKIRRTHGIGTLETTFQVI